MKNEYEVIGGGYGTVEIVIDDNYETVPSERDIQCINENQKIIQEIQCRKGRGL